MTKTLSLLVFVLSVCSAQAKTVYLLAVDGLSNESYQKAQQLGFLKDFKSSSAHISPFPSMTDLSWSEVTQTSALFGASGRIQSVEAVYFDSSEKSVAGDVRDYYRRLAQPKYYLNAFENLFNPYVEALMYFPTKELPKKEIQLVFDAMLNSKKTGLVTGYIGAIDSIAHTQPDRLYSVIQDLDVQIKKFIQTKRASGDDFELIILSDHGNVGRFQEGEAEHELQAVEMESVVKSMGFEMVGKPKESNHISMPLMALGTWAPVYFQNPSRIAEFVNKIKNNSWFDLAVELKEKSKERILMQVSGASGQAFIHYYFANKSFYYQTTIGNPLQISQDYISAERKMVPLNYELIEKLTRSGNYPDSIIRVIESVQTDQFDFPDLIITLTDGHYINNSLAKMTKMYRTHGSLTRASSLGVLASTSRALPQYVRSRQVLPLLQIKPEQLFGDLAKQHQMSEEHVIQELKNSDYKGIPTGARDYSDKRIFQMISKIISFSRSFFVISEIQDLFKAFSFKSDSESGLSLSRFNPSLLDANSLIDPVEIGELTDLVIQNPDIEVLKNRPEVAKILNKFKISSESNTHVNVSDYKNQVMGVKRSGMKIYQIPYLLDQALTFQEKSFLTDSRDLSFSSHWFEHRSKYLQNYVKLTEMLDSKMIFWKKANTASAAQRLFGEILKESILEERIAPEPLNLIYKKAPENLTIVYVPGTYNGIFDKEIFSLGLKSLTEDLGLRVLKAPIFSACASDVNGTALLEFLKKDSASFIARKQQAPQYLILGYSKGAVDALHMLTQDKVFAKQQIQGLITMASPLKGSKVLESADLPFFLVNLLIDEQTPEVCKSEKPATSSVSTQGMSRFWRQNEKALTGLTRYFSISFVSEPEESHLFMKITKMLGRFDEDNDGIVALTASTFPSDLQAIDLGVVQADHLAGILSSRFPQRAFLRAVVRTAAQLGLEDSKVQLSWKIKPILDLANKLSKNKKSIVYDSKLQSVRILDHAGASNLVIQNSENLKFDDPYELNEKLIAIHKDPAAFYEPKVKILANTLEYDPYQTLDLAKLPDILSTRKVTPATLQNFKQGIDLSFNHTDMLYYRLDHQWMYESRSPVGGDNNGSWGFQPVQNSDKSYWLALRSQNNSIRLTTLAYRFKPVDFPLTEMMVNVSKGPVGADPVKGKSGKDDSAFQVWYTLRDLRGVQDRTTSSKENSKVYTFGYYWGEELPNEKRLAGQVFENYYSNKNIIVATLPPAFVVVLNDGKENLGKSQLYNRNFLQDLKRAYPDLDLNQLEVIAITIQMDSNDTASSSEAFMKTLKLMPAMDLGLDVKLQN